MIDTRLTALVGAFSAIVLAEPALADAGHGDDADHDPISIRLEMPEMDAHKGRELFAEKGCIACHSAEDDYIFTSDAVAMIK